MNVNETGNVRALTADELDAVNGGVAPAVAAGVMLGAAAAGVALGWLTAQDDLGPAMRALAQMGREARGR
jgi:lactobin A/cerein 7B family class IIb bacteriocin